MKKAILEFAEQMDGKAKQFKQKSEERDEHDDISFDLLQTLSENVAARLRKIVEENTTK